MKLALLCLAASIGCSKLPPTRYYDFGTPVVGAKQTSDVSIAISQLATDAAYDDERIVYRTSPQRIDYYEYHRWSAVPGALVAGYLEQSLEKSGVFAAVVTEPTPDTTAQLSGRVIAIEEIDLTKTKWVGHIAIELVLTDLESGKAIWSKQFEETEPLDAQTPEGLARGIARALQRIVTHAAPAIRTAMDTSRREAVTLTRMR